VAQAGGAVAVRTGGHAQERGRGDCLAADLALDQGVWRG
jgi:hypothetical protein